MKYLARMSDELLSQREVLKQYINSKLKADDDYHAVSDAANDIRDIDAKLQTIREVLNQL